jgi:hypothetical protein
VLVDVELLVAPREQRQQHPLVHARDRVVAEALSSLAHVGVGLVDVPVVHPPPDLLGLVHERRGAGGVPVARARPHPLDELLEG